METKETNLSFIAGDGTMVAVWKYPIPVQGAFELRMPRGARILTAQMQRDQPMVWALVDTEAPPEIRCFELIGTGESTATAFDRLSFVGSFQFDDGRFVSHLFEVALDDVLNR